MSFIKNVKIFADGANLQSILNLYKNPLISGFTTNPTLMRKDGVKDYKSFAQDVLSHIKDRPFSFEVFSDDLQEMERQAKEISSWGENVYVKIPIMNTQGISTTPIIQSLSHAGVKLNITAVFTLEQVLNSALAVKNGEKSIISVFAGRIADTGVDPCPLMKAALSICRSVDKNIELLWASPRELLNVIQADECGTDIITVSHDLLKKINLFGKDLTDFSRETVEMFYQDGLKAGYTL